MKHTTSLHAARFEQVIGTYILEGLEFLPFIDANSLYRTIP